MIEAVCFDIETTSLNANFGIVLAAVIKTSNGKPKIYSIDKFNKKWPKEKSDDHALVSAIVDELSKYDILVAHNGLKFDIPYLKTRLLYWGDTRPFPEKKIIDPYQIIKKHLKLSSNSLESIADLLNLKHRKTPVDGRVWMKAYLDGCPKALKYIIEHCVQDVLVLEEMLDYVKGFCKSFNPYGSA
jgi:uncharacterized protein YprB with RNaseH-like and TPR domain